MMKVALSILLLLLPSYAVATGIDEPLPPAIESITGKLKTANDAHNKYLNIINEVLSKKEENFAFSVSTSGYKCTFNKFDIIVDNSSKAVNSLFVEDNEALIKDAINEYKLRLMLELDHLKPPHINLKNLKKDFQGICLKYFTDLRMKFFHIYRNDGVTGNNNNISDEGSNNENQLPSNYESSISDSDGSSDENRDLSEVTEDGKNENKNPQITSSYSFSSHSSHKVVQNGKEILNENDESNVSSDDEDHASLGPMTKEKALEIFLKNTAFEIEGYCTEEQPKEKPFIVYFTGNLSRNHIATACNTTGKNHLRGADGKLLPIEPLSADDMNRMMSDMFKFFESQKDAQQLLFPILDKFNMLGSLENIGFPEELDFDSLLNNLPDSTTQGGNNSGGRRNKPDSRIPLDDSNDEDQNN
ncbi:parasitophorous vacuolar protein 1, putative [Plasmodium malariae]|uniref:Parasitophorous vacuolar protein 1, putative n=1 Tax=Plasmodium malariae TaxID=5858 RepID=A0A1C3KCS5_PLAMA|nr:parasitophorous vacuolar protein 1, putative [Plasmodium malariae]